MARQRRWLWLATPVALAALAVGFCFVAPARAGETTVTVRRGDTLSKVLKDLESKGVVWSALVTQGAARLGRPRPLKEGVRVVRPHATLSQVLHDLQVVVQMPVRAPEGFWVRRTATYLEKQGFCPAAEYEKAAEGQEGRLCPDTYLLSPTSTASELVAAQLAAYSAKVAPLMAGKDERRVLTVASMVELEASDPAERRMVAGVIENRLARNMRLEIDATVLYAMQEWKVLGPGVVHTVKSPYNTYEQAGLPPGPICSPSLSSVKAALDPARHDYLFYVSRGDHLHLFAETYAEHQQNIRRARMGAGE